MASKMKELREKRGLGQKEVAAKLGIPVRTYGGYERGERTLSLDVAAQIADVLGVSLDTLMGREQRKNIANRDMKQNDMVTAELSHDEWSLIKSYRKCSGDMRSTIRSLASSLSNLPSESDYYYAMAIEEQEREYYEEMTKEVDA